jgi:hypothetical protein
MFMTHAQEQNYWVGGQSLYGNDAKDLIYRFQRVSPMEVSLFDSSVVYYGSQYVHRSKDGGVHWEKISPDLTAHPRAARVEAASRSRATSRARSSTARSTQSASRSSSRA